ncbi:hypothetical protein SLEP1_g23542 [Rubroshorea leprosula]|uniref:Uncharacterized protein n=1 Tax=Rubroshorea leprosula TaxID=152421 RepID=A0AAV5JCW1_9ROSI|nr:hypothetical protein SLEP1_g23542 [Rubroshorea leprosula]
MVSVPFLAADGDMSETAFLLTRASRLGVETLTCSKQRASRRSAASREQVGVVQQAESKSAQCSKQRGVRHSAASREGSGTVQQAGSKSGTSSKSSTVQQVQHSAASSKEQVRHSAASNREQVRHRQQATENKSGTSSKRRDKVQQSAG